MTKRLIITAAVTAAVAVSAPAASAAVSNPIDPPQQELGAAPTTVDEGVGTSPGTSSPDAAESTASVPVDEGISTSPGAFPATDPSNPAGGSATEQAEGEDQPDTDNEADCLDLVAGADKAGAMAAASSELAQVPGMIGEFFDNQVQFLIAAEKDLNQQAEQACGGEEAA